MRSQRRRRLGMVDADGRLGCAAVEFRVGLIEGIPDGGGVMALAGGLEVGVFRVGVAIHAFENRCAHQGGPVCSGEILGRTRQLVSEGGEVVAEILDASSPHLVCPWHGWEYDLESGELACDRRFRLRRVPASVRDGVAYLEIAS